MPTDLFIFTFNAAKLPQFPPSDTFLSHLDSHLPAHKPDLLIFNFQELSSLYDSFYPSKVQSYLLSLSELLKASINENYGSQEQGFELVGLNHLYSLGTLIFTSKAFLVESFSVDSISFGMFNTSLKGCIFSKLSYSGQSYAFLNCHLAANEGQHQQRIENLDKIYKYFSDFDKFGHVFILGDLNLRCDSYILNRGIENFQFDELSRFADHPLISKFTESEVNFVQTFKYLLGGNGTELNFKRNPSWCDRVLYLKEYATDIQIHRYYSIPSCTSSDHKPVYLHLTIPDRYISPTLEQPVQLMSNLELQVDAFLTRAADFTLWAGLFVVYETMGRVGLAVFLCYLVWKIFF